MNSLLERAGDLQLQRELREIEAGDYELKGTMITEPGRVNPNKALSDAGKELKKADWSRRTGSDV